MVGILVLQAEGLVCAIHYLGFFFQMTPADVVAEVVVGIAVAVIFFKTIVLNCRAIVIGHPMLGL